MRVVGGETGNASPALRALAALCGQQAGFADELSDTAEMLPSQSFHAAREFDARSSDDTSSVHGDTSPQCSHRRARTGIYQSR